MEQVKIKLDEKEVTPQELEQAKSDGSVRIVETAPGVYKTVKKLKG